MGQLRSLIPQLIIVFFYFGYKKVVNKKKKIKKSITQEK